MEEWRAGSGDGRHYTPGGGRPKWVVPRNSQTRELRATTKPIRAASSNTGKMNKRSYGSKVNLSLPKKTEPWSRHCLHSDTLLLERKSEGWYSVVWTTNYLYNKMFIPKENEHETLIHEWKLKWNFPKVLEIWEESAQTATVKAHRACVNKHCKVTSV